jgi:HSP20 family protein
MVAFKDLVPWREQSQVPARRDDFFDPYTNFRREVDRMFESFFEDFGSHALANNWSWRNAGPAIDVSGSDKELVVTAEVPGVNENDIEVTLADNILTVQGEKKAEHEQKYGETSYLERRYGAFSRSIRLPFSVKDEEVDATYDKGVLTIKIPKPAEAQRSLRKIEVKAA